MSLDCDGIEFHAPLLPSAAHKLLVDHLFIKLCVCWNLKSNGLTLSIMKTPPCHCDACNHHNPFAVAMCKGMG